MLVLDLLYQRTLASEDDSIFAVYNTKPPQENQSNHAKMDSRVLFVCAVLAVGGIAGKTSMGSCPEIEPKPGFNMNQFLGHWYVIQKTSPAPACLSYNITASPSPKQSKYAITEIRQHATFSLSSLHHEHRLRGDLVVPNIAQPAQMILDLPLDILPIDFVVYMTDYTNYAAVFTCKKLPLVHQWSAMILSRRPQLDMIFVDAVRTRLSSYNVDPFALQIVDQSDCAQPGAQGGVIQAGVNIVGNLGGAINSLAADVGIGQGTPKRIS